MALEIAPQSLEVRVCALASHEAELHQLTGRVIDEDQQRAGLATLLEPAMVAAIDLDQFAVALTPEPRLVEGSSCVRDSHRPSAIIHRRKVSLPIRS